MKQFLITIFILSSWFSNAQEVTAQRVIDKYITAVGGMERLKQINSFYSESKADVNGLEVLVHNKQMRPNKRLVRMEHNSEVLSETRFNGAVGFAKVNQVKKPYGRGKVLQQLAQSAIFPEFKYRNQAIYLGEEKVNGKTCQVIRYRKNKVYYDKFTGLKVKGVTQKRLNGKSYQQTTYFLNYKSIKGVKFPLLYKVIAGNKEVLYNVISIALNRDVNETDFN